MTAPSTAMNHSSMINFKQNNGSLFYAIIFFLSMIAMELALEGANSAYPDLESLPYAVTLSQFGFCFLLPLVLSKGKSLKTFPKTPQEFVPYISLSLVVFGSTCSGSMSVRYVAYPTKVVFKSAKLIPTMMVAALLQNGSKYGVLDYLAATMLCAGAAGYGWGGGAAGGGRGDPSNSVTGITLLLVSIFCDAFIPNVQQRLMSSPVAATKTLPTTTTFLDGDNKDHSLISDRVSLLNMVSSLFLPSQGGGLGLSASSLMTNANGVGCVGLLICMLLTGSLSEVVHATISNPNIIIYLTIIGLTLSTAVLSYTRLIQESGSVVAVAVGTLRKVATVILSYVVYPKAISMVHVVSGFLVLGGILLSSHAKQCKQSSSGNRNS